MQQRIQSSSTSVSSTMATRMAFAPARRRCSSKSQCFAVAVVFGFAVVLLRAVLSSESQQHGAAGTMNTLHPSSRNPSSRDDLWRSLSKSSHQAAPFSSSSEMSWQLTPSPVKESAKVQANHKLQLSTAVFARSLTADDSNAFPAHCKQWEKSRMASDTSRVIRCTALRPYDEQGGLYDYTFYHRFVKPDRAARTNIALLTRETRFNSEASAAPLLHPSLTNVASLVFDQLPQSQGRNSSKRRRSPAASWVRNRLLESQCRQLINVTKADDAPFSPTVYVVSAVRDAPKKAFEFVSYVLLLGASRVVLMDGASGTHPTASPLSSVLKPFVELDLVEIVSASDVLGTHFASLNSTEIKCPLLQDPEEPTPGSSTGVDIDDFGEAKSIFFTSTLRRIATNTKHSLESSPLVVVIDDVSDIPMITTAPKTRVPTSLLDYLCFKDVFGLMSARVSSASSSIVFTLPLTIAGPVSLFDNARTPFEASAFAMGNSMELLEDVLATVSLATFQQVGKAMEKNPWSLVSTLLSLRFALIGPAADIERTLMPRASVEALHFDLPVVWNTLALPDGTSWSSCATGAAKELVQNPPREQSDGAASFLNHIQQRLRDPAAVVLTARTVRILPSSQASIEDAVDRCYENFIPLKGRAWWKRRAPAFANLSYFVHREDGQDTFLGPAATAFDGPRSKPVDHRLVSPIFQFWRSRKSQIQVTDMGLNLIDDLPEDHSLQATGLVLLNYDLLRLMRFVLTRRSPGKPLLNQRRERTFTQPGRSFPIMGQVQSMLQPYVVVGTNRDAAIAAGIVPNSISTSDITNENLVQGAIAFRPEAPLATPAVNKSSLQQILDETFLRAAGGSSCPSFTPVLLDESDRLHIKNVTFCAMVRNRAKLTLEWILYHKLMGVSRFIILDDDSSDQLVEVLQPLIDLGIAEVHPAHDGSGLYRFGKHVVKGPLLAAYGRCVEMEQQRAVREAHQSVPWIGLIDSDEFLVLPSGECIASLVTRVILEQQKRHRGRVIGAIAFSWRNARPFNNDIFDAAPTQFDRTMFSTGESDRIQRVKVIARCDAVETMETAHRVEMHPVASDDGKSTVMPVTVFPNGQLITSPGWFTGASAATEKEGYLLHYHSRSLVSWLQRYLDGFADNNNHQWPFDVNTYFGRWFSDTAKSYNSAERVALEAIPGFKDRYRLVRALLTGEAVEPRR